MTHKKRGRPPLKVEEPQPRRTYGTGPRSFSGPPAPINPGLIAREHPQYPPERSPSSLRDLRPMYSPRTGDTVRGREVLYSNPSALSGPTSASPGQAPIPSLHPAPMHRPFPSMSSTTSSTQPPSPYFASPTYTPSVGLSPSSESYPRTGPAPAATGYHTSYAGGPGSTLRSPRSQQFPPFEAPHPLSGVSTLPEAGPSIFPRPVAPSRTLAPPQTMTELQLPPIRPQPPPLRPAAQSSAPPPATSAIPAPATHPPALPTSQPSSEGRRPPENGGDDEGGVRDAKRARMDLGGMLGPGQE